MKSTLSELKDKTILICGAGYFAKVIFLERAKDFGMKVVVVDSELPEWAAKYVDHFVEVDTSDRENAPQMTVQALEKKGITIDGVCSYWEPDVPLASRIAELLNLPGNSYQATMTARSKHATRQAMRDYGIPTPKFVMVHSDEDLINAFPEVGFPAVLKPTFGASAQGVQLVNNKEEALAAYKDITKTMAAEWNALRSFYTYGTGVVFEQYLDGVEVDVDIILSDGRCVFHSITDNLPTKAPYFVNTGSLLPATVSSQGYHDLLKLCTDTCDALGLKQAIMHIEAKYTSHGPHIVEVNARVCGNPYFEWINDVWGVDFIKILYMNALGIPLPDQFCTAPSKFLAGIFILTQSEGEFTVEDRDSLLALKSDPRVYDVTLEAEAPMTITEELSRQHELGWIVTQGATLEEAISNMHGVLSSGVIPSYAFGELDCSDLSVRGAIDVDGLPKSRQFGEEAVNQTQVIKPSKVLETQSMGKENLVA